MNDKTVTFGIIGCGAAAGIHTSAIKKAGANLTYVYDQSPERARDFSKEIGAAATDDPKELFQSCDVVNICTPSGLHAKYAVMAMNGGCHVMVEKPLALTVKDCDAVVEAAKTNHRLCSVISQFRFSDNIRTIKRDIETGRLGRITDCSLSMSYSRDECYYEASPWRGTYSMSGGGAVMNQGIHGVDLLRYLVGDVKRTAAFCRTLRHNIEVEDTAAAIVEFENGALGVIDAATSVTPGYPMRLKICGTKGSVVLEEDTVIRCDIEGGEKTDGGSSVRSGFSDPMAISDAGHLMQVNEMIRAVKGEGTLLNTPEDARKTVALVCALYESSQGGRITELQN